MSIKPTLRRTRAVALSLAFAALLTACGGGDVAAPGSFIAAAQDPAQSKALAATGTGSVVVRARATLASNVGPQMELRVDGVVVGSTEVRSAAYANYAFSVAPVPAGARVDIVFNNDRFENGEDRNLFVESITVGSTVMAATDAGVTFDRGGGSEAFDGIDVLPGLATLYWNGALRFTLATVAVAVPVMPPAAGTSGKKLIEAGCMTCGNYSHTPRLLVQQLSALESSPFDGVMVRATVSLSVVTKTAYPDTAFTQDLADLKTVASSKSKLTDNFLWMGTNSEESGFDWFSDAHWAATEKNIRNFARLAKAGGFKGIALDPENYNGAFELWGYPWQVRKDQKTYREYQAQVRRRGAQFVKAIQEEYPGAQIFSLSLASWLYLPIPRLDDPAQEAYMATDQAALWFYFIHGMLDALPSNVKLIDGDEYAYYFRRAGAFDDSRSFIRKIAPDAVILDSANRVTYDRQVTVGQAVYVDGLLNLNNWDKTIGYYLASDDERKKMLEHNIYHALRTSDEYVWMYSENMNYWTGVKPAGFDDTIVRARGKFDRGEALGFSIDAAVDAAYQKPNARQALIGPKWARE